MTTFKGSVGVDGVRERDKLYNRQLLMTSSSRDSCLLLLQPRSSVSSL